MYCQMISDVNIRRIISSFLEKICFNQLVSIIFLLYKSIYNSKKSIDFIIN